MSIIENQDLLTFYEFPPSIRRTIYSTNLIESFNKQIKKYSRRKEQFQNEESLERFLVSIFDTYNQKFLNRSHKGFQQVTDTLLSNPLFCRRTSYLHKIIDAPGWYNKNCSSIVTIDETT
jgi:hypothetical protein